MTRTRRFVGGVGAGLLMQVIVTAVGLWLTPFLIDRLGDHRYGLWLVATQLLSYLMLADLGVVALLPRETAYVSGRASGSNFTHELGLLVGRTLRIVLWQTALLIPVAVAMWALLPSQWLELRAPLTAVLAVFVLTFPTRVFPAVLNGLQDFTWLTATGLVAWALGMALSVALVLAGAGLLSVALGWVVTQLITNGAAAARLMLRYRGVFPSTLPPLPWTEAKASLSRGSWFSVAQIANALLIGSDLIILGKLMGPAAIVPYAVTGKLITVLAQQPSIFLHSALPALAELRAIGDKDRILRVTEALTQGMLLLSGLVVCVVVSVNRGFVGWWVDAEQYAGTTLTVLLLVAMLLRHWNFTLTTTMLAFGHERRGSLTALADGAVTVFAMVIAVGLGAGIKAAPLAIICGALLISLPLNLAVVTRDLRRPVGIVLRPALAPLWRTALIAAVAIVTERRWVPSTFASLAATTAAVTAVYLLAIVPLLVRGPLAPYIVPRIPHVRMTRWVHRWSVHRD